MADVRIAQVKSYDDAAAMARFVDTVIDDQPGLRAWLAEARPDRLVVVKPNWIQESHQHDPAVWEPVITHPNLVLAVVGKIAEATQGQGTIALCDAPHTYANFEAILARGRLRDRLQLIQNQWPDLKIEITDLRRETWITQDDVVVDRRPNPHDPRGYTRLNLGRDSLFFGHWGEGHYYGADYDTNELHQHHHGEVHEYLIAGTPMHCDLFVNLPKLKTHKKTGLTCCLKNLVGINGDKNWLPHHCEGTPRSGGDEFPAGGWRVELERALKRVGRRAAQSVPGLGPWLFRQMRSAGKQVLGDSETTIRNGNWFGNDTTWRMALDLNRALLYGNVDGSWRDGTQPKRYLAIVDGIVGGEGNGPIAPDAVNADLLIAGDDPAAVDAVAARLIGYAVDELPIVRHAFDAHRWPIRAHDVDAVRVWDERLADTCTLADLAPAKPGGFRPHFGWTTLREARTHGS